MRGSTTLAFLVALPAAAGFAVAPIIERVSVDSNGSEGNGASLRCSSSADGRWIAFSSDASNLVPNDQNGRRDIFVKDRQTGALTRVSVDSTGIEGDKDSDFARISADGRVVVFSSDADNLVAGDTNRRRDVFLHDLAAGTTERVSVSSTGAEAHGASSFPDLSTDGGIVAFSSKADDLVSGDNNVSDDVFVRDRAAGTTIRVSVDSAGNEGNGVSDMPSISGDGRFVAFESGASNLVSGDHNGTFDCFVHDCTTLATELLSVTANGTSGNDVSQNVRVSTDGSTAVFASFATDLVANDTNGHADAFARDLAAGSTELASVWMNGSQVTSDATLPATSSDGRLVAFTTGNYLLMRDRAQARTHVIAWDESGQEQLGLAPFVAGAGSVVAFESYQPLVYGDTNSTTDVYVRNLTLAGTLTYDSYLLNPNQKHPQVLPQNAPVLGSTFTLDLVNDTRHFQVGLFVIGLEQAWIDMQNVFLLVEPQWVYGLSLPPTGLQLDLSIPSDPTLAGMLVYMQLFQTEPKLPGGWDYSAGLLVQVGY